MNEGTLREVLDVERDIKRRLDAESANARDWLQRQKQAVERDSRSAAAALERQRRRHRAQAEKAAEAKAAEVISEARALSGRLEALDEAWLRDTVWRHIVAIAPGSEA